MASKQLDISKITFMHLLNLKLTCIDAFKHCLRNAPKLPGYLLFYNKTNLVAGAFLNVVRMRVKLKPQTGRGC